MNRDRKPTTAGTMQSSPPNPLTEEDVQKVVQELLDTDVMTPNNDGTPTGYHVDADNLEHLVTTVLAAAGNHLSKVTDLQAEAWNHGHLLGEMLAYNAVGDILHDRHREAIPRLAYREAKANRLRAQPHLGANPHRPRDHTAGTSHNTSAKGHTHGS